MDSQEMKAYAKEYYQAHKAKMNAYAKTYKRSHKNKVNAYQRTYYQAHKEQCQAYLKAYHKSDVNLFGQTKNSIRLKSRKILKKMNLHIPGYEIHHCFGYEDASKFIYISKSLHLKIHQYLRDHSIDASSDHWMDIRDIVISADEFKYIKC